MFFGHRKSVPETYLSHKDRNISENKFCLIPQRVDVVHYLILRSKFSPIQAIPKYDNSYAINKERKI